MSLPTKILLVDDQNLLREALALRLSQEPGLSIVATARDADAAVREAELHKPEVVLMDIDMPGRCCYDPPRPIPKPGPAPPIVCDTGFTHNGNT